MTDCTGSVAVIPYRASARPSTRTDRCAALRRVTHRARHERQCSNHSALDDAGHPQPRCADRCPRRTDGWPDPEVIDGLPREEVPSDLLVVPDPRYLRVPAVAPEVVFSAASCRLAAPSTECSGTVPATGRLPVRGDRPAVRFSRTAAAAASVPALGGRARAGRRKSTEHPARKPGVDRNLASPRVKSPTKPRTVIELAVLLPSGREDAGDRRRESRARRAPHSGPRRRHEIRQRRAAEPRQHTLQRRAETRGLPHPAPRPSWQVRAGPTSGVGDPPGSEKWRFGARDGGTGFLTPGGPAGEGSPAPDPSRVGRRRAPGGSGLVDRLPVPVLREGLVAPGRQDRHRQAEGGRGRGEPSRATPRMRSGHRPGRPPDTRIATAV